MSDPANSPSRRSFLELVGAIAAWSVAAPACARSAASRRAPGPFARSIPATWFGPDGRPTWTPVAMPIPSLADGGDARTDAERFARFAVRDEVTVPDGFALDVVASWGDRFGPSGDGAATVTFGFNCDFVGLIPRRGHAGELWMVVNHEFISARPWLQGYAAAHGATLPRIELGADPNAGGRVVLAVDGERLPDVEVDLLSPSPDPRFSDRARAAIRRVCKAALEDLGVSILHVRQRADGGLEVIRDSTHHTRIPGSVTHSNCSGAVTPWGSALTCEENIQDYVVEHVGARGEPLSGATRPFRAVGYVSGLAEPLELEGVGQGVEPPLDGRDFGWVCQIDPERGSLEKLRALGRFRHENVGLRVEAGKPLAAYMGDDRRGGHVWKFVSARRAATPEDPANARLFDDGTLHAARLEPDGRGRWIPLAPETPLARPAPEHTAGGHQWLPDRSRIPLGGWVAVVAKGAAAKGVSADEWVGSIERACGKPFAELTLGDLVWPPDSPELDAAALRRHRLDVLRLDAFVMANAAGATCCARPEAIEIHPRDRSVFIALTDAVATSSEGSPDARIFPEARAASSRRYGSIVRLIEDGGDGAAATFRWETFASSGEACDRGGSFACPDNLRFDGEGNLWVLTDMSTKEMHAEVAREGDSAPGRDRFVGVFGSSALFAVPTDGPRRGVAHPFAVGPVECEMCGVTFTPDGRTIVLAVQHPGDFHGTRGRGGSALPTDVTREIVVAARDGSTFLQSRTVPIGSNFPSRELGAPPRPSVVAIRRAK